MQTRSGVKLGIAVPQGFADGHVDMPLVRQFVACFREIEHVFIVGRFFGATTCAAGLGIADEARIPVIGVTSSGGDDRPRRAASPASRADR